MSNAKFSINSNIKSIIAKYQDEGQICTNKEAFLMYLFELIENVNAEEHLNINSENFPKLGVAIDGMYINQDETTVNLYSTYFDENAKDGKIIDKDVLDTNLSHLYNAIELVVDGKIDKIDKSNFTYDILDEIKEKLRQYEIVLNFYTNLEIPLAFKPEDIKPIKGYQVAVRTYDIYDVESRIQSSDDFFDMNLKDKFGYILEAIKISSTDEYDVYMTAVRGETLSKLYEEDSVRLLETNVRSYLKKTARVNKGILNTVKEHPEDFVAYNNGLATVATDAEVVHLSGEFYEIKTLKNWQIVNGGQTTATLFECDKEGLSLDKVKVPCKLTILKNVENAAELISNISTYSNTQTAIKKSDPLSSLQYYKDIEKKANEIWADDGENAYLCYFERTNGSYNTAKRMYHNNHLFDTKYPTKKKFTKIDLAKAIVCWEQMPYVVNMGQEKNFEFYTNLIKDQQIVVDEKLYQKTYATIILFREIDSMVKQLGLTFKSNVTTYTMSLLSLKANKKIDLLKIWKNQCLSPELIKTLRAVINKVHKTITSPPEQYADIRMWCRKEMCWNSVKKIDVDISEEYCIEKKTDFLAAGGSKAFIENTSNFYNGQLWKELQIWNQSSQVFDARAERMIKGMYVNISRKASFSEKQIAYATSLFNKAVENGFKYKQ